MSGLKIHILKLKSLYFTMLLFKYIKKIKKILIFKFMFIFRLSQKKKKSYKELEFTKLEFHKDKKLLIFKFMFICRLSQKKKL